MAIFKGLYSRNDGRKRWHEGVSKSAPHFIPNAQRLTYAKAVEIGIAVSMPERPRAALAGLSVFTS